MNIRKVYIGLLLILICGMYGYAHTQEVPWRDWEIATAKKLMRFLPAPAAGLIDRMPWDPEDYSGLSPESDLSNRSFTAADRYHSPRQFVPLEVIRHYRFSEPSLVKQYEQLLLEEKDLEERALKLGSGAKQEEYAKLGEALDKVAQDKRELESRSRWVTFSILTNTTPSERDGPSTQPVGTLKGHPMYRYPFGNDGFRLTVYLGPTGFKNPSVPSFEKSRAEVRSIIVVAELNSSLQKIKQDEALVQQMLEKVDYEGLSRLLKR